MSIYIYIHCISLCKNVSTFTVLASYVILVKHVAKCFSRGKLVQPYGCSGRKCSTFGTSVASQRWGGL